VALIGSAEIFDQAFFQLCRDSICNVLQMWTQTHPCRIHFLMLGQQTPDQTPCRGMVGSEQKRKQIQLLILMVILAGCIEITQYRLCGLLCLDITAIHG